MMSRKYMCPDSMLSSTERGGKGRGFFVFRTVWATINVLIAVFGPCLTRHDTGPPIMPNKVGYGFWLILALGGGPELT